MARCQACSGTIPDDSLVCSHCGTATTPDNSVTRTVAETLPRPPSSSSGRTSGGFSSRSTAESRFLPGSVIAGRYRVVALLGKGGMGEVYRADDLKLDQAVALKFLPPSIAANESAVERFRNEVRVARQVSHPNVCRVYDLGEVDGHLFLSMEYVDGEDLSSLLRRIGRLPPDKAVEIARGLCAGLAAAHDKGILHRDLKPGNVMLDGRGQILLMDFGLAAIANAVEGLEVRNGTPAYMAPEQLAGKEVTVRSDIYSLGLLLYEVFTGKRPYDASTLAELIRARSEVQVPTPSTLVYDMDPAIERVIMRCLQADPAKRPGSALAVAAALPGGDPLAAALAAGETPSPEMVAAAGEGTALSLKYAVPLLVFSLAALAVSATVQYRYGVLRYMDPPLSSEVLSQKARDLVEKLGYTGAVDEAGGYEWQTWLFDYLAKEQHPPRWDTGLRQRPPVLRYWYRQSHAPLTAYGFHDDHLTPGVVEEDDPPRKYSGMINISIDHRGRIYSFEAIPPHKVDPLKAPAPAPDWSPLFAAAQIDPATLQPAEPLWTFEATPDYRTAWTGVWPGTSLPLRIEAASFRGKPIAFVAFGPWTQPWRMPRLSSSAELMSLYMVIGLCVMVTLAVWYLRRARTSRGEGDQRAAVRLGAFFLAVQMGLWMTRAHFGSTEGAFGTFLVAMITSFGYANIVRIMYLAFEPWVRRLWPHALISWTSLFTRKTVEPIVGRDVLIGIALALGMQLIGTGVDLWQPNSWPFLPRIDLLLGARSTLGSWLLHVPGAIRTTIVLFLLIFVARVVLKNAWLAAAAFVIVFAPLDVASGPVTAIRVAAIVATDMIIAYGVMRYGLLTLVVALFALGVVQGVPITVNPSDFYFGNAMFMIGSIAALTLWAFYKATSGEKIWRGGQLSEM